ncbi:hypothetical protein LZ30DRAFT_712201 [Colletotrichum cereale]|nr:hypothetical protein LZ30DRAFT_712201 [Colletotrichum cereale]
MHVQGGGEEGKENRNTDPKSELLTNSQLQPSPRCGPRCISHTGVLPFSSPFAPSYPGPLTSPFCDTLSRPPSHEFVFLSSPYLKHQPIPILRGRCHRDAIQLRRVSVASHRRYASLLLPCSSSSYSIGPLSHTAACLVRQPGSKCPQMLRVRARPAGNDQGHTTRATF